MRFFCFLGKNAKKQLRNHATVQLKQSKGKIVFEIRACVKNKSSLLKIILGRLKQ